MEVSPAWSSEAEGTAEERAPVPLRNPLSDEFDTLRPSLLPGLLLAAQHNLRHGAQEVFLFEAGYAHSRPGEGLPEDRLMVAGVMLGSRWSRVWNADPALAVDFFSAKGAVETLARALGAGVPEARPADHPAFHPGRSAWLSLGEERLGMVGELHPTVGAGLDLPRGVFLFDLDAEALLRHTQGAVQYERPSRFPPALRDLAVIVERTAPSGGIERCLRESLGEWAREVRLFDVYSGKGVPEGKVSLAYALELGAPDRTLTDAEVEARLNAARERLRAAFGAEFRGG
jgi:phenylalanyl-tRNA synthetase beta chain